MKCPFLEEIVVGYCTASATKKMIPYSNCKSESLCYGDKHKKCSSFEEVTTIQNPKTTGETKTCSFFPPHYWLQCRVFTCNSCVFKNSCFAASSKVLVRGFFVPEYVYYCPNHTWLDVEKRGTTRLGIDDFAQKLLGQISKIELNKEEGPIKRGEIIGTLHCGERYVDIQSPIAGAIDELNYNLTKKPEIINDDPYGMGWMLRIRPTDCVPNQESIFKDKDARNWLRSEVRRLHKRIESELGVTIADGGDPLHNLPKFVTDVEWESFVKDFLTL